MTAQPLAIGRDPAALQVEVISDFSRLEAIASEWQELWEVTTGHEIFHDFRWIRAWWDAYGERYSLYTLVVRQAGEVIAILPLAKRNRVLCFLGDQLSDYNNLLARPGHAASALASALTFLWAHPKEWRECRLDNVSEHSLLAEAVRSLPADLRTRLREAPATPCPALRLGPDREAEFGRLLGKPRARRLRRGLSRYGSVRFRHLADREAAEEHLPRFARQHIARRAIAGDRSHLLDPRGREFYRALIREFDPGRELRFAVLTVGARPVAYHFGYETDRRLIWYTPAFDVDWWDQRPGEVLLYHLLEYAQASRVRELDFTRGSETYKSRFCNLVRTNLNLRLFSTSADGSLGQAGFALRERLRLHPQLYSLAVRAVRVLARLGVRAMTAARHPRVLAAAWKWARHAMYTREATLVHRFDPVSSAAPDPEPNACAIAVRRASLSELAVASLGCPGSLTPAGLRGFRDRVKRGHTAYAAWVEGRIAQVAWVHVADGLPGIGAMCDSPLPEPGLVVSERWRADLSRQPEVDAAMARFLARLAKEEGRSLWMVSPASDAVSRKGIEEAGFRLFSRVTECVLLGFLRRARVTVVSE